MKISLSRPETNHEPMQIEVEDNDYSAIRQAMFEFQVYTESDYIVAFKKDSLESIAELRFEWIDE